MALTLSFLSFVSQSHIAIKAARNNDISKQQRRGSQRDRDNLDKESNTLTPLEGRTRRIALYLPKLLPGWPGSAWPDQGRAIYEKACTWPRLWEVCFVDGYTYHDDFSCYEGCCSEKSEV